MDPTPKATYLRFHVLDGLRAIAALHVALFHMIEFFPDVRPERSYLAVDLFFLLSGFVIAHSYDGKLAAGLTPLGFLRARTIRLYPLYLAGTLIGGVMVAGSLVIGMSRGWTIADFVPAFSLAVLMLPSPFARGVDMLYPFNVPAWSIAFELLINAVYAALFDRFQRTRFLVAWLCVSGVAVIVSALAYPDLDLGPYMHEVPGGIARVAFSFVAGVGIYRVHRHLRLKLPLNPWLIMAVVCLLFWLPADSSRAEFELTYIFVLFPLIVLAGAAIECSGATARLFDLSGSASYALYVIHVPAYQVVYTVTVTVLGLSGAGERAVLGVVTVTGVCVAAVLLDRFYDGTARKMLQRGASSMAAALETSVGAVRARVG